MAGFLFKKNCSFQVVVGIAISNDLRFFLNSRPSRSKDDNSIRSEGGYKMKT